MPGHVAAFYLGDHPVQVVLACFSGYGVDCSYAHGQGIGYHAVALSGAEHGFGLLALIGFDVFSSHGVCVTSLVNICCL